MIATVLSITLGTVGNGVVFASATSDEVGDTGGDSNSDDQDTEPEPEDESESEPSEPVAPQQPEARVTEPFSPAVPAEPEPEPLPCIPDKDPGCTSEPLLPCVDFDHPACPEPGPEKKKPLPYCDKVGDGYTGSCHDRYDYDDITKLYPCNDGTQKSDPLDCKDASLTPIPLPGDCHPDYDGCIPNQTGDALNCDDIPDSQKPVRLKGGNDPYNLDRDKDGIGCEDGNGGGSGGGFDGTSGGGTQASGSGPINMVPKPGQAAVRILYEGSWSGSVSNGNFDSASYDGSGTSSIAFDCGSGDIYSLTIQKGEDNHDAMTLTVEDYTKKVLDHGRTSAEFGIVSLSGTC